MKSPMFHRLRLHLAHKRFMRAWHAWRTGDPATITRAGEALLALAPDDHQAHNDVGAAYVDVQQHALAERCLRRAVELQDGSFQRNNLGRALLGLRRFDDAKVAFLRAAEMDPTDPRPRYNLTVLLREEGKKEEAIEQLFQFIRAFPTHGGGQNDLGCMYSEQGQHEKALFHFSEAIRLAPDHFLARVNLIRQLCDAGRYPETTPHLEAIASSGMRVRVKAAHGMVEITINETQIYRGSVKGK